MELEKVHLVSSSFGVAPCPPPPLRPASKRHNANTGDVQMELSHAASCPFVLRAVEYTALCYFLFVGCWYVWSTPIESRVFPVWPEPQISKPRVVEKESPVGPRTPDLGPKIEVCDDTTLESELTEQNSHQNFGVIIKDRDTRHEVKMKGSSQGLKVKPVYHPLLQVKLHLVRFFRPFQRCPALYFYRQGQAFKLSTEPLHSFQEVFGLETSHFQQFKCPPPPQSTPSLRPLPNNK